MSATHSALPTPHSARKTPPSDRDLEVYESVCIAGRSLRAAAEHHNLSVTRVRQLVQRVVNWLADTLPPETDLAREKQLQLARHIAADQLQYARAELMELWRQTQNPSYLLKTTRLTLAAARLGVVPGKIDGLIADAYDQAETNGNENVAAVSDHPAEVHSEFSILNSEFPSAPPPFEDCAPAIQKMTPTAANSKSSEIARHDPATTSSSPAKRPAGPTAPSIDPCAPAADLLASAGQTGDLRPFTACQMNPTIL